MRGSHDGVRGIRSLAGAMMIGLIAGCGTVTLYDDPDFPEAEAATVRFTSSNFVLLKANPAVLNEVNGRKVRAGTTAVRLRPGRYTFTVSCYQSLFSRNRHQLGVRLEAGGDYLLRAEADPEATTGSAECLVRLEPA